MPPCDTARTRSFSPTRDAMRAHAGSCSSAKCFALSSVRMRSAQSARVRISPNIRAAAPPRSGSRPGSVASSRPAMRSAVSFARGSGLETISAYLGASFARRSHIVRPAADSALWLSCRFMRSACRRMSRIGIPQRLNRGDHLSKRAQLRDIVRIAEVEDHVVETDVPPLAEPRKLPLGTPPVARVLIETPILRVEDGRLDLAGVAADLVAATAQRVEECGRFLRRGHDVPSVRIPRY